jgi:hypothetical protein
MVFPAAVFPVATCPATARDGDFPGSDEERKGFFRRRARRAPIASQSLRLRRFQGVLRFARGANAPDYIHRRKCGERASSFTVKPTNAREIAILDRD